LVELDEAVEEFGIVLAKSASDGFGVIGHQGGEAYRGRPAKRLRAEC
jgi:hypothetical protein